jgi:hypothetical protein
MTHTSVYNLFCKMDEASVVLAYRGEISSELLESIYQMMDTHLKEANESPAKRKKFFHILVESLQNVFHHQEKVDAAAYDVQSSGFIVSRPDTTTYRITTGNYIRNSAVDKLKERINKVNGLSPQELREHYRQSLTETELSEKGGAGLGIIEMVRKSGRQLDYEFIKVDDTFSFFSVAVTLS